MKDVISTGSRSVTKAPQQESASRQVKRAEARRAANAQTATAARPVALRTDDCRALLRQLGAPVSDDARAFYLRGLDDDASARNGARLSPSAGVDRWITVAKALVKSVLAGLITGYGAMRLRFATELAAELAARLDSRTKAPPAVEGVPATPALTPALSKQSLARTVAQALRIVGVPVDPLAKTGASRLRVAHSFKMLADAVLRAQTAVPADVLADAGLTLAVLDALAARAHAAMRAHGAAVESRADAHSAAWSDDVLLGRLDRETRFLRAAARACGKADGRILELRSPVRGKRKTTKPTKPAPVVSTVSNTVAAPTSAPVTEPAVVAHPSG